MIVRLVLVIAAMATAAPVEAQTPETRTHQQLEQALAALKAAPDEQSAAFLEQHIRGVWLQTTTPAVRLLLARGMREMEAGAGEALDDIDAALDLDANFIEAWHARAQARYRSGDYAGAIRDIEETLRREPRHFGALQDLSHIAEARGDWRGAYAAWAKALELDPMTAGGQTRLKDLRRRAFGDVT